MHQPHVGEPFAALPDTHVLPTYWPAPGLGTIPMNAFLIRAAEPVLVDTGAGALADGFLEALAALVDPAAIRWIWLTHEDRDHTGSLTRLLDLAPRATVLGTFMTFGRFSPDGPLPPERTRIVNPGDAVPVGDRILQAVRPPVYDSPGTLGLVDPSTGAYFSSDAFGAPLPGDLALERSTSDLEPALLHAAQVTWATADCPWVTTVDADALATAVRTVGRWKPSALLSTHLPPVHRGITDSLAAILAAREAEPTPGPTQAQIEALLAEAGQPTSADPIPTTPSNERRSA